MDRSQYNIDVYCNNQSEYTIYLGVPEYTGRAISANSAYFISLPDANEVTAFSIDSIYFKQLVIQDYNLIID